MSSIFDAAVLAVYNFQLNAHQETDSVEHVVETLRKDDPTIRADFLYRQVGDRAPPVRISLPRAVHEADHDAWKHLEYLKTKLCEIEKLDCHWAWAPLMETDRSRKVNYSICPTYEDLQSIKSHFGGDCDPNLKDGAFRLKIINAALATLEINPRAYELYSAGASSSFTAKGHVNLGSPTQVTPLVSKGMITIPTRYSKYQVEFNYARGTITPTSCATIGLVVRRDGRDESMHRTELKQLLARHNQRYGTNATISNIRMSKENEDYLLCDPSDIITAQRLCRMPMPNKRYFRQTFFANAHPANYTKNYEIEYDQAQKTAVENAPFGLDLLSNYLEPIELEIEARTYDDREQETGVHKLRQTRSVNMFNWYADQAGKRETPPQRMVQSLYGYNTAIAEQTEFGTEHVEGSKKLYSEDMKALETQIAIHEQLRDLSPGYHWAKMRKSILARILERINLRDQLATARRQEQGWVILKVPTHHPSEVQGQLGEKMTPVELKVERERLKEESDLKIKMDIERLEKEISLSIANDPSYESPTPDTSTSSTSSIPEPTTPPNTFQVVDPGTPLNIPGSEDLVEKKPEVTALKRKHDELSTPTQLFFTPEAQKVIDEKVQKIRAKRISLRPFMSIPTGLPSGPRDSIQNEIDRMESELAKYKSLHGTARPSRQVAFAPPPSAGYGTSFAGGSRRR